MFISMALLVAMGMENFIHIIPITRAEAVTMIGRANEISGEKSKRPFWMYLNHFASGYINSTTNEKIIVGFQDHTFRPSTHIIRGDVAVILQTSL